MTGMRREPKTKGEESIDKIKIDHDPTLKKGTVLFVAWHNGPPLRTERTQRAAVTIGTISLQCFKCKERTQSTQL